ncbi:MAG: hypothetical protein AAFY21_14425 [Cyanobacteria bacterium J06641_2]
MRYKTLPIGLLAAISIINSTVLPASANPRRTRQDYYQACIDQTYSDFKECKFKTGEDTYQNASIAFGATPGTIREKAFVAGLAATATISYGTGKCITKYVIERSSCKSKVQQLSPRKKRRNARRRYRRRTSRRLRRANY